MSKGGIGIKDKGVEGWVEFSFGVLSWCDCSDCCLQVILFWVVQFKVVFVVGVVWRIWWNVCCVLCEEDKEDGF